MVKESKLRTFIAWVGSVCFMLSGAPSAIDSIINKSTSIPLGTLILWSTGELCLLFYIYPKRNSNKPLISNYLINIVWLAPMWYYKLVTL